MNYHFFYLAYCRTVQAIFRIAMPLLPWRKPEVIEGPNSVLRVSEILQKEDKKSVLIVTDELLSNLGLLNTLIEDLTGKGINVVLYNKTVPNPSIENIEEGLILYQENKCQAIIAFGGGSPMDCAKVIGARVVRPNKSVQQLKGQLKVRKKTPLFFAIPTTAGTGSEVTLAAVISNKKTLEKYAINDTVLIPNYAVLDPLLTIGLPPFVTSTTGMDVLTHAVEAYIGNSNTRETEKAAIEAIKLVNENLLTAFENPSDVQARAKMQRAAYLGGVAFTRAYVGNVHAVAHTLGGFYGVPHGLANAVLLPPILKLYGKKASVKLAQLSDHLQLTNNQSSTEEKANAFISFVISLNEKMGIPSRIREIKESDIPNMAKNACKEANPLYPVPVIFTQKEMEQVYHLVK